MLLDLLVLAGAGLLSFMIWSRLHELAHLGVAHVTCGVADWTMHLWPHWDRGRFYWSRVEWTPERPPTTEERGRISLAPRHFDLLGCIVFPITTGTSPWIWMLVGGALVDLIVGSIGWSESSDLRRAADAYGWNPWAPRLTGFAIVAASVTGWFLLGGFHVQ